MKQTTSRLATRQFHQWLIPEKTVIGLFSLAVILVFAGAILCAVASVGGGALAIIGGILLSVGIIMLMACIFLCAHAWCVWYVRDSETQTIDTAVVGTDVVDGNYYPTYGFQDANSKKAPNGVLRDGRHNTTGSLSSKKHVTISPSSHTITPSSPGRQTDLSSSSGYSGSRAGMSSISSPTSPNKSGPGSVGSGTSTLASFAYLNEPNAATPYSTLNQNQSRQAQVHVQGGQSAHVQGQGQGQTAHQVPIKVESNYNSFPRHSDGGRTVEVRPYNADQSAHSNIPPARRHSDDDYDNADMGPMLNYQTYQPQPQPVPPQPQPQPVWQQQQHNQNWQQGGYQHSPKHAGFQHSPQQHGGGGGGGGGGGYQQSSSWQQQQSRAQNQQQQQQQHHQQQQPQQVWQSQPASQSSWKQVSTYDEPPPPQPMVYPSARRPMTFEQISSSKVSLYDNIQMARRDDDE